MNTDTADLPMKEKYKDESIAPMHTCEHIVNRTMVNLFGCGRAFSAHIEKKKSKLDYHLASQPAEEQIRELEETVNRTIRQNLPVTAEFITRKEAAGRFDLSRLPEEAPDTVRIVRVGDYDECPCLGSHVSNTSEIGTFKITSEDWNPETRCWRLRYRLIQ